MGCSQSADAYPATDGPVDPKEVKPTTTPAPAAPAAAEPAKGGDGAEESSGPAPLKKWETRRRVAVAGENSEMLASMRWRSAIKYHMKPQEKAPEHLADIKKVLNGNAIFSQLEPAVLDTLATKMQTTFVAENKEVIKQGDPGDCLYVVLEGAFSVFVDDEKKDVEYGPGDCFGELALLYEAKRAATVVCTSNNGGLVEKLDRIDFRNHVSKYMAQSKQGLDEKLKMVPALAKLTDAQLNRLVDAVEPMSRVVMESGS